MVDDVLVNKIATIQNCLRRISEEYKGHEKSSMLTLQDKIPSF